MKTTQFLLIFVLVLSILANMFLFFALGVNEIDWEHRYNQSNSDWEYAYTQNYIEWCELTNDQYDLINDLVIELQYYNSEYEAIEYLDQLDCWGDYGTETD